MCCHGGREREKREEIVTTEGKYRLIKFINFIDNGYIQT